MKNRKKFALISGFLILIFLAFMIGWFVRERTFEGEKCTSLALRATGFKFIKPLLICDTNPEKDQAELKPLEKELQDLIEKEEEANNINDASVYFQDFKTDGRVNINKDEKFDSASIGKVATMIVFYKLAESIPSLLSGKVKYEGVEMNSGQEIQPKDYAKLGEIYTVDELIEKMIKYSDNNSLALLRSLVDVSKIKLIYKDLQIPIEFEAQDPEQFDWATTRDISYFFRVLYNSTFLRTDLSEKALGLLAETDYKNGLMAGVPDGIDVAHKFGLRTMEYQGTVVERELHDCGIIYHPKNPYLLCIMTKSSSGIPKIENTIKNISAAVYKYENSR